MKNEKKLKHNRKALLLSLLLLLTAGLYSYIRIYNAIEDKILAYTVDPKTHDLRLYWKNDNGQIFGSIQNVKSYVESKKLTLKFAMNGGMFTQDLRPLGLFIQDGKMQKNKNTANGSGNFYLKPNGVFYITTDRVPFVCQTADFKANEKIKYATQSGPMLVIDGQIHPAFKKGSTNLHIRNGVGVLPNNKIIFAMSKTPISLYDFAKYFQSLGCKNALYLDGYVCRTYLPEKSWTQTDGNFGVIIGVTTPRNN